VTGIGPKIRALLGDTANGRLLDAGVRHAVFLRRYAGGQARSLLAFLEDEVFPDLIGRVESRLDRIASRGLDRGPWTTQRYRDLLADTWAILRDGTREARGRQAAELRRLAKAESAWAVRSMSQAAGAVDITFRGLNLNAVQVVVSQPIQGRPLASWWNGLATDAQKRVTQQIGVGLAEGETTQQITARVRTQLELPRRQAEAVARTAVNHVSTQAREATYAENSDMIQGVQWVSTLDTRTTPICQARDGQVFPPNEGPRPPAHPNCLPGGTLVASSTGISGVSARWADGEVLVLKAAGGLELTATPNHPVLTGRGWVAAHAVHVGDHVVRACGSEWPTSADGKNENVPTRIEDVARAFLESPEMAAVPMPTSPEHFHGDGRQSKVAVVGSDGQLRSDLQSAFLEHVRKARLKHRHSDNPLGSRRRAQDALRETALPAPRSSVSCRNQPLSIDAAGALHPGELLLMSCPPDHPGATHDAEDNGRRDAELLRDARDATAEIVEVPNRGQRDSMHRMASTLPHLDASGAQPSMNRGGPDVQLAADLLAGHALPVELCQVIAVERKAFHGMVYNLETGGGFYVAGGLIVHNCRSTTIPVLKSWRQLGIDLGEAPAGTRASMDGQVAGTVTYGDWLEQQTQERQDEALGPARARLFRAGRVTVEDLVARDGRPLTLEELERLE
jgi:SPP1 gp7 family putative phage head morphogenesis protein